MPVLDTAELQTIMVEAFPGNAVPVVETVTDEYVIVCQPVDLQHGRPGGTLSGPTMMMLADTAAWMAILAQIGPVLLAVTTSLHIDFLRKPELVDLEAEAVLLKLGRRLGVAEVALTSSGGPLVAKAQVTYSIPPPASDG